MSPIATLGMACAAFVGSHFALSHPLRAPLSGSMGEGVFRGLYALVAFGTFGWIIWAWLAVPATAPAYVAGDHAWIAASIVMWLASVLLAGSFFGNPAMPSPGATAMAMRNPLGVFAITRHPMMWSFAIWALVHILLWPTPENHVLTTAIIILALGGAAGQDRKKAGVMGDAWRGWCRRTSFFPFAGQFGGRISWGAAWPGSGALLLGTLLWLAMTWAHTPLGSRLAAGIWRWW
ncbi:MAG: NnrU family protein [Pseudomonadota bacterium]